MMALMTGGGLGEWPETRAVACCIGWVVTLRMPTGEGLTGCDRASCGTAGVVVGRVRAGWEAENPREGLTEGGSMELGVPASRGKIITNIGKHMPLHIRD